VKIPATSPTYLGEKMDDKEIREKTKHRTFTSMAQRRRWIALQEDIEKNKEKKEKTEGD